LGVNTCDSGKESALQQSTKHGSWIGWRWKKHAKSLVLCMTRNDGTKMYVETMFKLQGFIQEMNQNRNWEIFYFGVKNKLFSNLGYKTRNRQTLLPT
jgi:hypothetical protein